MEGRVNAYAMILKTNTRFIPSPDIRGPVSGAPGARSGINGSMESIYHAVPDRSASPVLRLRAGGLKGLGGPQKGVYRALQGLGFAPVCPADHLEELAHVNEFLGAQ